MRYTRLDKPADPVMHTSMGVSKRRESLLIRPSKIANIAHSDRKDSLSGGKAYNGGDGGAQHDVAVAGDDAASHSGDQDVDTIGQQPFTRLACWRQRGDGVCEVVF